MSQHSKNLHMGTRYIISPGIDNARLSLLLTNRAPRIPHLLRSAIYIYISKERRQVESWDMLETKEAKRAEREKSKKQYRA